MPTRLREVQGIPGLYARRREDNDEESLLLNSLEVLTTVRDVAKGGARLVSGDIAAP